MPEFRPFRLTFRLQTPVALGWPWIALDGLLMSSLLRREYGERFYLRGITVEEATGLLDRVLARTGPVYHASVSEFDSSLTRVTTIYKRFDTKNLPLEARGKLRIASGHFRFFALRTPYRPCTRVTFHGKGDLEAVEELAGAIPSLGKERNVGFGFVKDFELEEIEEDLSLVRDGVAMRPLPLSMLEAWDDEARLAYRPPYWLPENVAPCAPPGARVRLRGPQVA